MPCHLLRSSSESGSPSLCDSGGISGGGSRAPDPSSRTHQALCNGTATSGNPEIPIASISSTGKFADLAKHVRKKFSERCAKTLQTLLGQLQPFLLKMHDQSVVAAELFSADLTAKHKKKAPAAFSADLDADEVAFAALQGSVDKVRSALTRWCPEVAQRGVCLMWSDKKMTFSTGEIAMAPALYTMGKYFAELTQTSDMNGAEFVVALGQVGQLMAQAFKKASSVGMLDDLMVSRLKYVSDSMCSAWSKRMNCITDSLDSKAKAVILNANSDAMQRVLAVVQSETFPNKGGKELLQLCQTDDGEKFYTEFRGYESEFSEYSAFSLESDKLVNSTELMAEKLPTADTIQQALRSKAEVINGVHDGEEWSVACRILGNLTAAQAAFRPLEPGEKRQHLVCKVLTAHARKPFLKLDPKMCIYLKALSGK